MQKFLLMLKCGLSHVEGSWAVEKRFIFAASLEDASSLAHDIVEEWVQEGDWGKEGEVVQASLHLWEVDDDPSDDPEDWADDPEAADAEWEGDIEVEPDHKSLILDVGGDPDCDHDWTSEGVWSLGGTMMVYAHHCRRCGLRKAIREPGEQRNPGEHETVEYTQPESWCAECESEERDCEEKDEDCDECEDEDADCDD